MAEEADLAALCTVCRAEPPRYKCPRCGARTCSLACVRRHKSWAQCSGIRDVTAYVPRERLRTPAGIDHDYNFLSGIERARRRVEREVVEERGLLRERDLQFSSSSSARGDAGRRPDRRFREEWHGDELRFVPNNPRAGPGSRYGAPGAADEDDAAAGGELSVAKRKVRTTCRRMGIELLSVPKGLSRHRENLTAWNKRTGRLNWQIEWLVYEDGSDRRATRILRKALDEEPIYRAFAATMEWVLKTQGSGGSALDGHDEEDELPRKKRKRPHSQIDATAQSTSSSTWSQTAFPTQNPITGGWEQESGYEITAWARDVKFQEKKAMQFFLLRPKTSPRELILVDATDSLSAILPGRAVLEFPTVFVLLPGAELPPGHILGSTERKELRLDDQDHELDEPNSRSGGTNRREFPGHRGGRGGARGRGRGRGGRYEIADRASASKRRKIINQDGEAHSEKQVADDTTSSEESSSEAEEDDNSSDSGSVSGMDQDDQELEAEPEAGPQAEPVGKRGLVAYGSSSEDED
ncbi:uncharacterized protein E0L32_007373 [Thyridium curvatum]|uniref:Box C/D snoRNA protein 1 n=1 Tax=Thyridium curvatum TaxID=1093900 RepID=A0A507AMG1_9PEZI|nr:uncharacterized protein E0L32_007373 [Thyridium curvatum]TPX11875.1 hypothetical protein E0L32_007373 [Thyridium curvatum]